MSLGLWEHFFSWPAASTSTSTAGSGDPRKLINVSQNTLTHITIVRL